MALNIAPSVAPTVFEEQSFLSQHVLTDSLSTSLAVDVSSVTVHVDGVLYTGTSIVVNYVSSLTLNLLTVSGVYLDVFNNDNWLARAAETTTSNTTYEVYTRPPECKTYYAGWSYNPDTRASVDVSIAVNTSAGTGEISQLVRNNWNLRRRRLLDFIRCGQEETNGALRAPDFADEPELSSVVVVFGFEFTTSLAGTVTDFNLRDSALAAGWDGTASMLAKIYISTSCTVRGSTTSTPAFRTGVLSTGTYVNIFNSGYIVGRGGTGGQGASIPIPISAGCKYTNISPGSNGGDAIYIDNANCSVVIDNTGTIGGGGGGGGAGASNVTALTLYSAYGGSGGGGAGFGAAGTGSGRLGQPGTLTAGGVAGAGQSSQAGPGGAGGALGRPGARGGGSCTPTNGGAAGRAVVTNGASVIWYRGYNTTQVLGSVI